MVNAFHNHPVLGARQNNFTIAVHQTLSLCEGLARETSGYSVSSRSLTVYIGNRENSGTFPNRFGSNAGLMNFPLRIKKGSFFLAYLQ